MTQKRLLSTGAALLAALCLLLALAGCGGEKPLLDQPIKTLTCVEPTALPTLVPLGDGRVLAGWVDYENEMTHLSVVDVAADKELAAQTLEGCWELQTEQFTDGSAVLFNWDGGAWQFIDASLTVTKTFHAEQYGGVFSHDGGTYYFVQDDVLCRADVASGQTKRVPLSSELRFMDVAGIFPDSETLFLHCPLQHRERHRHSGHSHRGIRHAAKGVVRPLLRPVRPGIFTVQQSGHGVRHAVSRR